MADLPTILLLGDSIRMSYQPHVARLLEGKANVVGPAENGQFSLYTLASLTRWLNAWPNPTVVHWNNGLHDVGHKPGRRPIQIPLNDYAGNLGFILRDLRATGAKVIWATTTPAHPDRPFRVDQWSWRNDEIDRYNHTAADLMRQHGVPINDLHQLVAADMDANLAEDQLHLSDAGQQACAKAVAAACEALL